jgi:hypothetical protein
VVDDQLVAAVEELRQRARAVVGVEPVLLLESDPGQLAPQTRQLVAQSGLLLLAGEQFLAGGKPLLTCSDPVVGHVANTVVDHRARGRTPAADDPTRA